MLLTWTPVPGTTSPEPVPFEQVTLAHMPSPSTAVMWVVEPSRSAAEEALGEALVVEAGEELLRALGLGRLHRRDHGLEVGRPPARSSSASANAIRIPPGDGGGLVSTSRPRNAAADRLAVDRLVGVQVGRRQGPAALEHPVGDRRRDLAAVERLRALGPEALERVAEVREAEHVALGEQLAAGRVELCAPPRSG